MILTTLRILFPVALVVFSLALGALSVLVRPEEEL
jgi:hypothetical protein